MSTFEAIPKTLGIDEPWSEQGGVYWLNYSGLKPDLKVRDVAAAMNTAGARFITITAYELPKAAGFRLEYHWDLGGRLLGVAFQIGNAIDSIYDLSEAVDWIEREVHEGFGVNFLGREYEPLLLRAGDRVGVNMREEVAK